jgi:hypothetical protein
VPSKTDKDTNLMKRMNDTRDKLPKHMQGENYIKHITKGTK